jgi:acyl-CoA thioesterase I
MRRALLLAALLLTTPLERARAETSDCSVPEDLIAEEPRLPVLAERLRLKQPITIVAIGGASTAGTAAGKDESASYPRRLEDALRRRHPDTPITVVNKGLSRETTQHMVERFASDVYALQPTLVIWETGTFDAAESLDVDDFSDALSAGLAGLHEHSLETMLVNMQYSRSTDAVIDFAPYLDAMQHMADVEGIYLFRRFEMMKYWSENGIFDFADVPAERRATLAAAVYECIAERLADAIDYATK